MTKPFRLRPFVRIGLAAGEAIPAARMNIAGLQARVLALRGEWK